MKKEIDWEVFHKFCNKIYELHSHNGTIKEQCWKLYGMFRLSDLFKREDKGLCTEKNCPVWREEIKNGL